MTVIDNVLEQLDFGAPLNGSALSVSAESVGETTVISVGGEIDASNADFTATVLHGFATCNGKVVVDLSSVDFIGTQGLRLLIEFDDQCRRSNTAVVVVPCRMLRRLLEVVGMGRHLSIAESVTDALRAVDRDSVAPGSYAFTRVAAEKLRC